MAGIATGAQIATDFDVVVLEQEFQTGYHSTGRSAAVLHLAFENDLVHRMSLEAEEFYLNPPTGFGTLVEPIAHIAFDLAENQHYIDKFMEDWIGRCPWLKVLDETELHQLAPLLNEKQTCGLLDERSLRLDVDAILQGFTRLLKSRGGVVHNSQRINQIDRTSDGWTLTTVSGSQYEGEVLINAAGAWADQMAELAGVSPLDIQPQRRTGVIVQPETDSTNHPMCYRSSGGLYFKPEGSMLMVSPADATHTQACDAQPDELDVAIALDTLNQCTQMTIERPVSTWAGLRSFAKDDKPVVGWDVQEPSFFWVAGLGGFGIQTAPSYSRIAANLLRCKTVDEHSPVSASELSPSRFN